MARLDEPRPKTPAEMRAFREAMAQRARDQMAAKTEAQRSGYVREFWSLIDTSGGIDACHLWTGHVRPHNGDTPQPWYEPGLKVPELGWGTSLARRIVCLLTFGRPVPDDRDTSNLCDVEGCCNVRHIIITPKGGTHASKLRGGVPAEEFFCS